MKIIECVQRSNEWFQARLGMTTASNFHKVLNKEEGRGLYMRKLAAERLTGLLEESYRNKAMENGISMEAEARSFYELLNDCMVHEIGFVKRDDDIGGSPDGFVGEDGFLEIKCPLSSTHIEYIIKNRLPSIYRPQVQGLLWITKRKWCDFVSYDPRVIARPMFIKRIKPNKQYIRQLSQQVGIFVKELKAMVNVIDNGF